ncbi:ATPase [Brumimicrobium glaciale]|uniref:ATPase n=1 Tax=Brumimicrobium glaciale TaxID=200475 RepID=A0A4Q4KPP5_9FLAO|nr:ATP-binding protein [Brumimicrobium glaciale]RYM33979.1 ATPase [Brumimicrobium glaciale]
MIGRKEQKKLMNGFLDKKKSAFLAVTGRRRVGKTYLIDEVYDNHLCLRITGIQDADIQTQIYNFTQKIAEYSKLPIVTPPNNWQEVFSLLKIYLGSLPKTKKQVIFIDELPWIATKRSGFIQLLAHLWNDYLSKEKHFILVVCGSATSWITEKIVNDKGGFHNRLDQAIQLKPFTLKETKDFLMKKEIKLTDQAITEIYMVMGGIPYYLDQIKKGESVRQIIARLCFAENGILKNEYVNLYKALFENSDNHEAIVAALATSQSGLTRIQIISKSKVKEGGPYTRAINDLLVSGFVEEVLPYGRSKRGALYRLIDEYSVFYHKFITKNKKKGKEIWATLHQSQQYKIWTGYAFENLCQRHIDEIKNVLGISSVYTEHYSFNSKTDGSTQSNYQIDLIIDRKDDCINLCECKFHNGEFTITKEYAAKLRNRKQAFIESTKTKKTVFNTLITNHGVKENEHFLDVIDVSFTVSDLMKG